ncbi:MAG: hypothetical protein DWQ34_14770 [Planctomycetota bacterium]|nr:MAG: hypothetical protein DWQ34_14770 [Planctomycetota bacterium]REK20526.1 MAG: hypothetical protein DWQ41_24865 [Planctomycetota bacterium]REK28280.1 MAG: hypothetical protein DWQ45_24775 [Planctomycetota bacterium]
MLDRMGNRLMRRPRIVRSTHLALLLCVIPGLVDKAAAQSRLRIDEVVWGFDGTVVPQAFNPVSFVVHNNSSERYVGNLWIQQTNYVDKVDAPVLIGADPASLFLEPGTQRRVQMCVYVGDSNAEFSAAWGPIPGRTMLGQSQDLMRQRNLTMGRPATVILFDPNAVTSITGGKVPRFDETFFPISVTGTAGLAAVLLDHQPQWQEARQQAFVDWLRAGGVVHLFQKRTGEFPRFRELLEPLNSPLEEFAVGQGRVVHHNALLSEATTDYVETAIAPHLALQLEPEPEPTEEGPEEQNWQDYSYAYTNWALAPEMFPRLKEMTRPDHNWALIYLMAFVYLLIIFPGCWLIGRNRGDYRVTYGAMIGAVVLFSMGFKTVGQRGYGEQTSQHSVSIARPIDDERILVRQWSNFFVTDGDEYLIHHEGGTGLLYSTAQTMEAVAGAIIAPPQGHFIVDIPPFSSRTLASAGVQPWNGFSARVAEINVDSHLRALNLELAGTLPSESAVAYVAFRDQVYRMRRHETSLQLGSSEGTVETFLEPGKWNANLYDYGMMYGDSGQSPEKLFETSVRPMIAHDLGIHDEESRQRTFLSTDRLRLYVYTEMPQEMFAETEYLDGSGRLDSSREGRVLYVLDLERPQTGETQTEE